MSEILKNLNPGCNGCRTLDFCVKALNGAVAEMGVSVEELDRHQAAEAAGRRSPVTPAEARKLTEIIMADTSSIGYDKDLIAQTVATCPGQTSPGECGLSPGERLDMMPASVKSDPENPTFVVILMAAMAEDHGA